MLDSIYYPLFVIRFHLVRIFELEDIDEFLDEELARAAACSGVAEFADFFDAFGVFFGDQAFDRFFFNAETSADQSFFALEFFDLQ